MGSRFETVIDDKYAPAPRHRPSDATRNFWLAVDFILRRDYARAKHRIKGIAAAAELARESFSHGITSNAKALSARTIMGFASKHPRAQATAAKIYASYEGWPDPPGKSQRLDTALREVHGYWLRAEAAKRSRVREKPPTSRNLKLSTGAQVLRCSN
jgi:hypothetical protein